MKLSVIILNYNVRYFLEQSVRSVQKALEHIDSEIIVVDNNSSDDSCEMMREEFPGIPLISNAENTGFSKANNQGVALAKGEFICILNPDTAVPHHIFKECLDFTESTEDLGIIGVRLLDGTGNFLPESKRNVPTPKASFMKIFGLAKRRNSYYALHVSEKENSAVAILPGAFMFMRKSVYDLVGGFDEDYFMYGEDIDLSYKVHKNGFKNHYLGTISMLHYKGESTQRDKDYYDRFYGAMNIFYNKHFPTNFLMRTIVRLGVACTKILKRSGASRHLPLPPLEKALLLTDDFHLIKRVTEMTELPVRTASKIILDDYEISNTLFIFDESYMSYSQILMIMDRLKNRNNRFRIRPAGCNFFLGSDRSDEKGIVTVF